MAFYQVNLAIFATGAAILVWLQYMRSQGHERSKATSTATSKATYPAKSADEDSNPLEVGTRGHVSLCASEDASATARQFQREFYVVYALAVAADWLQVTRPLSLSRPVSPSWICRRRLD